jgi:hypothetical protein
MTAAFAGTITSAGVRRALRLLAEVLAESRGRLLIFGPLSPESAKNAGLTLPNVELRGLLSSPDLIRRFREEADLLFVPMSFEENDRANVEISFPSKLTDYTTVGIPLLIYGPDYSSAVRWAKENAGVAEVVSTEDQNVLVDRVLPIARDPEQRMALGRRALKVGNEYFSSDVALSRFHSTLCDPRLMAHRVCSQTA